MKSYSATMFASLLTTDQQQHENNFDDYSESSRDITELDQEPNTTTIIVNNPSDTSRKAILDENDTRETWTNNCDYLITTLGGLIGLGECFENNLYIRKLDFWINYQLFFCPRSNNEKSK